MQQLTKGDTRFEGADLTPLWTPSRSLPPRPAFSASSRIHRQRMSLRTDSHRFVYDFESGEGLLFDLVADPREQRNVALLEPDLARSLRERLLAHRERVRSSAFEQATTPMPPETEEGLRALGYLE